MTFEEKVAQAEALWAQGPRKFQTGDIFIGTPVGHEPNYKGAPIPCVSNSMPTDMRLGEVVNRYGHKVRQHSDGTMSTMDGRPIFDTARNRAKHLARAGWQDGGE